MVVTILDILVATITVLVLWIEGSRKKAAYPPGPAGVPLLGNVYDLARATDYIHWAKHKDLYGPISSVTFFGQKFIIINDRNVAVDLLEKRSHIYSDRPKLVFGIMCGLENYMGFVHNNDYLRAQRRVLHQAMGTKAAVALLCPTLEDETHKLLGRMLKEPDQFIGHIRLSSVSNALRFIFGYTTRKDGPDANIVLADHALEITAKSFQAGRWLVDILPQLQYLPEWLPGMGFKKVARSYRLVIERFTELPFAFTKHQMEAGVAPSSIVSSALLEDPSPKSELVTKWASSSSYGASVDTTQTVATAFAIAMLLYPEVQKKAQSEIDNAVGSDRMPTFADRDNLPYVNALIKELLRWHSAVPLGLPHASSEDDVYDGYLIPKGSILLANIWLFNHDPAVYPDPFQFKPERYLAVDGKESKVEPDSASASFGFGRRICSGHLLADANIYILVVTSLAIFRIEKASDSDGRPITPKYETNDSAGLSYVKPFPSCWKVRSSKALELLTRVLEEMPEETPDDNILATLGV